MAVTAGLRLAFPAFRSARIVGAGWLEVLVEATWSAVEQAGHTGC